MPAFSDMVDLRSFRRAMRLGYQTINRLFANLFDELVPLLERKLDDTGKVLGREHARVTGTYVWNGAQSRYDLQGQNPDYPYLPSLVAPGSTGVVTLNFVTPIGTSDYDVSLVEHVVNPGYVQGIGIASGSKSSSSLVIFMGSATVPVNVLGFDIEIRWG